jgi:hypothetical protein
MMSSFRHVPAAGPQIRADLLDHGADVVGYPGVGEAQDGVPVQLELNVSLPVSLEGHRTAVFRPVDLDYATLVRPQ